MASIIPLLNQSTFEPEVMHARPVAFDDICQALKVDGDAGGTVRIIELAPCGQRDGAFWDTNGGRS